MTTDPKHGILQDKSGRDKRKQQEKAMFAGAWSRAVSQPVITDRALGSSPTPVILCDFVVQANVPMDQPTSAFGLIDGSASRNNARSRGLSSLTRAAAGTTSGTTRRQRPCPNLQSLNAFSSAPSHSIISATLKRRQVNRVHRLRPELDCRISQCRRCTKCGF
jgi:hypothetical protein